MAFTSTQRGQIRYYLGWSFRFGNFDSRLEQAMNTADNDPDVQTQVLADVTKLTDLDTKIGDCYDRLKAIQVGSITLPGGLELAMLRSEGRRIVSRVASYLGVEVRHDVYSPSKFNSFAGYGGLVPGNGGNIRQG